MISATIAPLRAEPSVVVEREVPRTVVDDEAAKPLVADQDVGAQSEDEVRDVRCAGRQDRSSEIVGRVSGVEKISGAADPERRQGSQRNVALEMSRIEARDERIRAAASFGLRHGEEKKPGWPSIASRPFVIRSRRLPARARARAPASSR